MKKMLFRNTNVYKKTYRNWSVEYEHFGEQICTHIPGLLYYNLHNQLRLLMAMYILHSNREKQTMF